MAKRIDQFGYCVKCGKNMVVEKVIEGKVKISFTIDYDNEKFLLNDGSQMRVAICKTCKAILTKDDEKEIMETVIAGWQKEVDGLKNWSAEKKKQHMDTYSKKKIITKVGNKNIYKLQKELKEHNDKEK